MATEAEIAWAAGIFEGEGCISWSNRTTARGRQRFQSVTGVGSIRAIQREGKRYWRPHHKPAWQWEVRSRADVEQVIRLLLPWWCARRSGRANEVLAEFERTRDIACETCGCAFQPDRSDARYCSVQCKTRARSSREGHPPLWRERSCTFCGGAYIGGGQRAIGYCSRKCRYYARRIREGFAVPEGVR
jgi:hypothetical protein